MKKYMMIYTIIAVAFVFTSCEPDNTKSSARKEIEINSIDWIYRNIHPSFWKDGFNSATLFVDFGIRYSGSYITAEDIEYAEFFIPAGNTWSFTIDADHVDSENNIIDPTTSNKYSTNLSPNGSVMPVGPITFEVKLTNGYTATYTKDFPIPGKTSSDGYSYLYTVNYAGLESPPAGYSPMLKRASIGANSMDSTTISIVFTIDDTSAFSGDIVFYDRDNNYVGITADSFVDYSTSIADNNISIGAGFNDDPNTVTLTSADITFKAGKSFSDIDNFHIIVTDGSQYVGTYNSYDMQSISEKISFL